MAQSVDVAIVGAGPGGYVAAIRAAQLGMKVAVVEEGRVGGVCLNVGCIPTKALLRSAEVVSLVRRAGDFGISFDNLRIDFGAAVTRSRQIVSRLVKGVEYLFKKNKITLIPGRGRLTGPGRLEVDGPQGREGVQARVIILATGSRPKTLPGLAFDSRRVISSTEALELKEVPRTLAIIGAGAVGMEFADVFAAYGAQVTLIEMLPSVLPVEDPEAAAVVAKAFTARGMTLLTSARVDGLTPEAQGVRLTATVQGQPREVEAEVVLVAVGRAPNVEGLGLEALGVAQERGFIKVGRDLQSSVPGIYAIGDLVGPPMLAHKAMAEGVAAAEAIAGVEGPGVNYSAIANVTYCRPEVASLGLTEGQARERGHEVRVGKFPLQASGRALTLGEPEGLVKVVADAASGELIGVHIVGHGASDLIAEAALARTLEATPEEIARTVHPHPTLPEALFEACLAALGRALHS
ncbi:MAG: dihydrolipoyl dehydrogenase [Deltaproteobacteria bacterium]|nr:dihydrolipoyl dehydrogenase [Deltaproteobacteria bacterium]